MSIAPTYPHIDAVPKEILIENICSELGPTDYKNFLVASRRINTEINEYKEEYKNRFYKLQIKVLANSVKTKPIEEIYNIVNRCCIDGNALELEAVVYCGKFHELEDKQKLFSSLAEASKKDHQDVMRVFIRSGRFNELINDRKDRLLAANDSFPWSLNLLDLQSTNNILQLADVGMVCISTAPLLAEQGCTPEPFSTLVGFNPSVSEKLIIASTIGHLGAVRAIMNSSESDKPNINDLEVALINALESDHLDIAMTFLRSDRFHEFRINSLEQALIWASVKGFADVAMTLINSNRFHAFSTYSLEQAIVCASGRDSLDSVMTLVNSNRFHEFSMCNLERVLVCASKEGYLDVVKACIESGKLTFDTASSRYELGEALFYSSGLGHLNIIKYFLESGMFSRASIQSLEKALIVASTSHLEVVKTIISSDRFAEFSIDRLKEALNNAAKYGQINIIRTIIKSKGCARFSTLGLSWVLATALCMRLLISTKVLTRRIFAFLTA